MNSEPKEIIMRYFALLFVVVYVWFAYLQLNDPDPIWWTTLYLIPAYLSFRAFQRRYNPELLITFTILYLAYSINSWLQMTAFEGYFTEGAGMEMKTLNQELAREASGLAICIFTFLVYLFYALRKTVDNSRSAGIFVTAANEHQAE